MMKWPSFYVCHENNHQWGTCGHCGLVVICGHCKNTTCTGGANCKYCDEAYEFYEQFKEEATTFYAPYLKEIEDQKEKEDE